MSKGLEALSDLRNNWCSSHEQKERAFNIIEKELKALEIIKEHWNFEYLKSGFCSKGLVQIKPISTEDANLLTEVLL